MLYPQSCFLLFCTGNTEDLKRYEFAAALVTGQLLGLDVGSVLELTNYFLFPVSP
jgi:predicted nucleotidyltransferase